MRTGLFLHNFGDSSLPTWNYGANTSQSKNFATGIVAAHVYETPGTYTITSLAVNDLGETDEVTNVITVSDPDTQWAGTKTICVSGTGDFSGAPAGATLVPSSNATTAVSGNIGAGDVRILFNRGETFTAATACVLNQAGPGYVGAFGTGAKPIIQATTNNSDYGCFSVTGGVEDWRIVDLQLTAPTLAANKTVGVRGNGLMNKLTILRCDISATYAGLTFPESAAGASGVWTDLAVVDSTISALTGGAGGNGAYLDVKNLMWMGNDLDDTTAIEHGLRVASCVKGVITNSNFSRAATGKVVLTLRAPDFAGSTPIPAGTYTQYIVVSDNVFTPSTLQVGNVGIGPLGTAYDGRLRNLMFERNFFEFAVGGIMQAQIVITASNFTARNNVLKMQGTGSDTRMFSIEMMNTVVGYPVPNDLQFANNTTYTNGTGTNITFLDQQQIAQGAPTNVVAINNIFYAPLSTTRNLVIGGTVTRTTNTTDNPPNQSALVDPLFEGPLTTPLGFAVAVGSYATNGGTAVFPATSSDFFNGRDTAGSVRIGAIVPRDDAQCTGVAQ